MKTVTMWWRTGLGLALAVLLSLGFTFSAHAQQATGRLTLYMGNPEPVSRAVANLFEKETGIRANFVRLSAGEAINRIRAERQRPQASVLYGIGLPTILALKAEGLLEPYFSPNREAIPERFRDPEGYWTATDVDFIGFATNAEFLERNNLEPPRSWEDLLRPEFRQQVAVANPATSGTGFMFITTLVQLMGEDAAFEYLKRFDEQVVQYTRSGIGPAQMVGSGEAAVAILFAHDILGFIEQGYPLVMSVPEEGTGYDLFLAVLIKDGPEPVEARKFIDWALTPPAQEVLADAGYFDIPTHPEARLSDQIKPFVNVKLIDYDFEWAGQNRDRLVEKFQREIIAGR